MTQNGDLLDEINIAQSNASLPRRVRFGATSAKIAGGALLVFLIGVIGYSWIAYNTLRTMDTLETLHREGSVLEAVVTASKMNHSGVYVRYEFSVDGISYSGRSEMKTTAARFLRPGNTIQILYLPNNPEVNLPSSWKWFSIWDLIPSLFLLFTTSASTYLLAVVFRERQLARNGIIVEGRVSGCAPQQGAFTVYYDFTTEDNVSQEGSDDGPDEFEIGAAIPIIYLRRNPKRNCRYPIIDFPPVD